MMKMIKQTIMKNVMTKIKSTMMDAQIIRLTLDMHVIPLLVNLFASQSVETGFCLETKSAILNLT